MARLLLTMRPSMNFDHQTHKTKRQKEEKKKMNSTAFESINYVKENDSDWIQRWYQSSI